MAGEYFSWLEKQYASDLEKTKELIKKKNDKNESRDARNHAEQKLQDLTAWIFKQDEEYPHFLRFYLEARGIDKDWLSDWWYPRGLSIDEHRIEEQRQLNARLLPVLPPVSILPPGSWGLQFCFQLAKPYISRGDNSLHLIDNPIKRDTVFRLPYISPGQWKGVLRAGMVNTLAEWWQEQDVKKAKDEFVRKRLQITRLCGNETEVELEAEEAAGEASFNAYLDRIGGKELAEQFRKRVRELTPSGDLAGRIHFYPTFFKKTALEVINPHNRLTGAGTLPIYLETVPQDEQGEFKLLYVPLVGNDGGDTGLVEEGLADLELVAEALEKTLLYHGIGAKTSSGFGTVKGELQQGSLCFRIKQEYVAEESSCELDIPEEFRKYLDADNHVKPQFLSEQGEFLSNKVYKDAAPEGGGSLTEFKQFRNWYKERILAIAQPKERTLSIKKSFTSFTELKAELTALRGDVDG